MEDIVKKYRKSTNRKPRIVIQGYDISFKMLCL